MKIISLSQSQFKNYASLQHNQNFGQSVEYTTLDENICKRKLYLGLTDNSNNIYAAAMLLITNISPTIKEAFAPDGFLIDYANYSLVISFVDELKDYLEREKITYLITDPVFKYKVYNKKNVLIENNGNLLDNLINLGFKPIGYRSDFEKHDIIIENYNSSNDIYRNFNRNTKRNIKTSINMGITLYKGNKTNLEEFYNIIKKKTKSSINYYYNLMTSFNSPDNKMEIFLIKLNPHKYLVNSKKLYEQEKERNEQIHKNMQKNIGHITEKILNKKINSDNLLEKYNIELNKAIKLFQSEKNDIVIGTCAIIKNKQEIYFFIDGYKEKYRSIHSSHLLKWAIIKKYYDMGYRKFNLGEINNNYLNSNNKYHGQYMYKIGFGGNIIEYPPNLLLVINKFTYNAYLKLNKFTLKRKSL